MGRAGQDCTSDIPIVLSCCSFDSNSLVSILPVLGAVMGERGGGGGGGKDILASSKLKLISLPS